MSSVRANDEIAKAIGFRDAPMRGEFRQVDPPRRLVFTNNAVDADDNVILNGLTTVTFEEEGRKTKMTFHTVASGTLPQVVFMLQGMEARLDAKLRQDGRDVRGKGNLIMQFITFSSPAKPSASGTMPDAAHMEKMGKLMTDMMARSVLVATGGIMRAAMGAHITLANGDYKIREGADQVLNAGADGFAILQSESKETLLPPQIREFLGVAGDGTWTCFPLMGPPPQ